MKNSSWIIWDFKLIEIPNYLHNPWMMDIAVILRTMYFWGPEYPMGMREEGNRIIESRWISGVICRYRAKNERYQTLRNSRLYRTAADKRNKCRRHERCLSILDNNGITDSVEQRLPYWAVADWLVGWLSLPGWLHPSKGIRVRVRSPSSRARKLKGYP